MGSKYKFFEDVDGVNKKEKKEETWEEKEARRKRYQDKLTPEQKAEREKKIVDQKKPRYKKGGIVSPCEKFSKLKVILKKKK